MKDERNSSRRIRKQRRQSLLPNYKKEHPVHHDPVSLPDFFSTIAHEGSFARTAEQLHLTPSAISHAVSTMEAECGFPLFTRTKSGVTMTAAAENLLPAIQRLLASSESLDQSIAQINGMHKGVLRLGVFNSACVTWLPQLVPQFQLDFPGIDVQIYQGSYADICAWVKKRHGGNRLPFQFQRAGFGF